MRVYNFHSVLPNQFKLHDHNVVLYVLQIDAIALCWLRNFTLINRFAVEEVLDLLLPLAFNEKLVPVISLLVNLIVVHCVFYLNKLRDRASLKNFLPTLLLHRFLLLLDHQIVRTCGFINCL